MSDLISRSELLKSINEEAKKIPIDAEKYHIDTNVIDGMNATLKAITNIVKEQPTTYDVEKVVEELKNWSFEAKILVPNNNELGEYEEVVERKIICTQNAIEIVKQGVVSDDVYEWKYNDTEYCWES